MLLLKCGGRRDESRDSGRLDKMLAVGATKP